MKKFLLKLMTVVMTVVITTASAVSCGLFEINTDRDMKQVVATVDIDKTGDGQADKIYKRELISGYLSYGYQYVQSYGYTVSQAYELILDNLVNNEIIVQKARHEMASTVSAEDAQTVLDNLKAENAQLLALFATEEDVAKVNSNLSFGGDKYLDALATVVYNRYNNKAVTKNDAAFRFVSEDVIFKAISDAKDSVKSLVESFSEETETHEHEHVSYTVRTTPTMSEDEEDEIDVEKCKANKLNLSSSESTNALADAYDRFIDLGLIDSGEKYVNNNDISILNLSYFKVAITSALEGELVSNFEEYLRGQKQLTDATALYNLYNEKKEAQEAAYSGNITSYETELGAVSDSSFVVYHPETGYSYVSHILVKYEDADKADLDEEVKGNFTKDQVNAKVDEYASKIVATDLRSSWVQAGYGVYANGEVTFTDKYVYTDVLAKFDGTIEKMSYHAEENADGQEILSITYYGVKGNDLDFNQFSKLASEVINGDANAEKLVLNTIYNVANYNDDADVKKGAKERFEDLKFAYSEDEGNFNSYLGYLYSPYTSSTQYVKAFAKASKEVTEQGAGSYKMFMSYEYGLHIVFCTEIAVDFFTYDSQDAFSADLEVEGTAAYNFKKANNDLLESNYISKLANSYVTMYNGEGYVTKYEKAFSDLITEEA